MRKYLLCSLLIATTLVFSGCSNHEGNKLKRQMKTLAKEYLENNKISDYDSLSIECVDTLTELGYAKLTSELLANMEEAYQMQLASTADVATANELNANLNEIVSAENEFEDLMDNGDLKTSGILLFMVTGTFLDKNKDKQEFMFLVNSDKKTLHVLDPFGNNLLQKNGE